MADYSYALAMLEKYKNAKWTIRGNTYEGLEWLSLDIPKPSKAQLDADYVQAVKENEYKEKRRKEYPPIADQLDIIYDKGIDGWKADMKKIKDKHPKPE